MYEKFNNLMTDKNRGPKYWFFTENMSKHKQFTEIFKEKILLLT